MSLFERGGEDSGKWVVEVSTPGWGRGRIYKSLPAGVKEDQAKRIHSMVQTLVAMRVWDIITAILDDSYPITQAEDDYKTKHPALIRESWAKYRRRHSADRIDSEEVIEAWLSTLPRRPKAETKRDYRRQVRRFFKWVKDNKGRGSSVFPQDFNPENLRAFQGHLMGEYLDEKWEGTKERYARGATANRYQLALRTLGTYLVSQSLIEQNWARTSHVPKLPERKNKDAPMSRDEWAVIRRAAQRVDEINAEKHAGPDPYPGLLYWDYLVATGALAQKEATEQACASHIRIGDRRGRAMVPVEVVGTKSRNRDRMAYIPESLANRLMEHCKRYGIKGNELLFADAKSKGRYAGKRGPWNPKAALEVWDQVMEEARKEMPNLRDYKPRNLRHTFARFAIEGNRERGIPGLDLRTVAEMMGHGSNISTTERYLIYKEEASEVMGGWMVALNAGLEVEGSHQRPEQAAKEVIVEAAKRAGLDPEVYFGALLAGMEE